MAGVKLHNIVVATLLFYPTTTLFLPNKAEISDVLHQQCCTILSFRTRQTLYDRHYIVLILKETKFYNLKY